MELTMMKAKLHRACVTETDLHYEGSLMIDKDLLEQSGILPNERIEIWNINNGARFATYAIEGPHGSGVMALNGAASRMAEIGDFIIVCAFARMSEQKAKAYQPTVLHLNPDNSVKACLKAAA